MTDTVLEHNTEDVYLYVGNNRDQHRPDLHSVTYLDGQGSARTIHVPADLGFDDPHKIIDAVARAHEAQVQFVRAREAEPGGLTDAGREQANQVFNDKLAELAPRREGGGY